MKKAPDAAQADAKGKGAEKPKMYKRKEWKEWGVDFRLDALSLLYQGSQLYSELKPDEEFSA